MIFTRRNLAIAMATSIMVTVMAASAADDWASQQTAFLAENAKKPGWKSTPSGLQYNVLKAGDGKTPRPAPGSEVTVHYEGKLITGKLFDSSYERNEPATFPLSGVIFGWQEGVPLMRVGEVFEFAIPANLGYGDRALPSIPAQSVLMFKVELLKAHTPAP
ncbi:MAG: FKBP-type peptidyl-prolyl cis-trans isomerase [Alphaproteobacteria bacterium]|nr:FKBP-type peptidyl-prolyl cis-trans isomerase [Alphaproteobacteria bacterium]